MDMNFNQKELEVLSEALDEFNYSLDMQLDEEQDFYGRKRLVARLQAACDVSGRIFAALALETEVNELGIADTP